MTCALSKRDYNKYCYAAAHSQKLQCRSCLLGGWSKASQTFRGCLKDKLDSENRYLADSLCGNFRRILEALNYENQANGGCLSSQSQSFALYLLLTESKEKHK